MRDSLFLQTLLFDKRRWTKAETKAWLRDRGYRTGLDDKPLHYRARQVDPSAFRKTTFRTIRFGRGIQAVVGKLKG